VKEFLSRAGATFTVMNVDEDDRAYDDLLALGFRTIPVTVVNGRAVAGFDPAALRQALDEPAR
jgi:glutaredoxin-like protein NrdH